MHTHFQVAHMRGGFTPLFPTVAPPENETGWLHPSQVCQPVSSSVETNDHEGRPLIKVLLMGDDVRLSESRAQILRACGFSVQCCFVRDTDRCAGAQVEIVVFCQTVKAADASMFAAIIRTEHGGVVLVRRSKEPHREEMIYDLILAVPVPPALLVGEMMRLRRTVLPSRGVPR